MLFNRMTQGRAIGASLMLFLSACADMPTPTASAPTALSRIDAATAHATATARHLVYFAGGTTPSGLAARVSELGGQIAASYEAVGIVVVDGLSEAAALQLAGDGGISAVDADDSFQFLAPDATATVDATNAAIASPTNPSTAAFFPFQWNMRVIGADAAWAAGQLGSSAVKVAILDTGIDYLHPDLAGRVDLANSASFVPAEDPFVPILFPGRQPFTDLHYHGTHVAATVSSNAFLAAGVGSRTTLMAVKVLSVSGTGTASAILGGIVFATDRGAQVINLSLGVEDLLSRKDKQVKAFQRMVDRAFGYAHSKGVMIVAAAGNESQDLDAKQTFKAYCGSTHVTCVAATGPTSQTSNAGPWANIDAPASYTNFGVKHVDLAAPGGNGASLVWGACSTSSLVVPQCQTALFGLALGGTSQAAPHVSGAAALVLAQRGMLPPGTVEAILLNTSDDVGEKGKDAFSGRGRLNVRRALGL
jgi:subtilisin family serine protease